MGGELDNEDDDDAELINRPLGLTFACCLPGRYPASSSSSCREQIMRRT